MAILSTTERQARLGSVRVGTAVSCVKLKLGKSIGARIIGRPTDRAQEYNPPRGTDLGSRTSRATPANLSWDPSVHPGSGRSHIRIRLRDFSRPGCHQSKCLRIGHGEPLLRSPPEERKDSAHLRSVAARGLRERSLSPRWIVAMLVSHPPSRPTHEYLAIPIISTPCHSERRSREEPAVPHGVPIAASRRVGLARAHYRSASVAIG
jgi:hypothetical protein